jgi:hypothetical protein
MAVNTLLIASRLRVAERDGRLPEELAQIFWEVQQARQDREEERQRQQDEMARLRAEIAALQSKHCR